MLMKFLKVDVLIKMQNLDVPQNLNAKTSIILKSLAKTLFALDQIYLTTSLHGFLQIN